MFFFVIQEMLLRLSLRTSANWFTHLSALMELRIKLTVLSLVYWHVCIAIGPAQYFVTPYQASGVKVVCEILKSYPIACMSISTSKLDLTIQNVHRSQWGFINLDLNNTLPYHKQFQIYLE